MPSPVLGSLIPDTDGTQKTGRRPLLEHRGKMEGPEVTQPHQTKEGALLLRASVGISLRS